MKTTVILLALALLPAAPSAGHAQQIIDVPLRFEVRNVNNSGLPCESDGATYTIHGSLVAPSSALASKATTLYVHGLEMGQALWRGMDLGDPYDLALAMARRGRVSVTIDLVGYGKSVTPDGPDGFLICYGSVADMIHQIVGQLRTGAYAADGIESPRFDRIALAGHAGYAPAAQLAAYAFGGIDALLVLAYGGMTARPDTLAIISASLTQGCRVQEGGSPKWDDKPGPARGYYWHFPREQAAEWWFDDAEAIVEEAWTRTMERDPCGAPSSATRTWVLGDTQGLPAIDVPVLVALGELDAVYPPSSGQLHASRFTGSDDVELMIFPGAGHLFHLERKRDVWIGRISDWLAARGL